MDVERGGLARGRVSRLNRDRTVMHREVKMSVNFLG